MSKTTGPINCLAVSGSLREASSNTLLLRAAVSAAPDSLKIRLYESLGDLPHFNPDIDPLQSGTAADWIARVRESAGFIVSTPEYAHGIPGSLKNGLDWLVGSDAFVNKPFMLLNASSRSTFAQSSLVEILTTMSGIHVEAASLTIPVLGKSPEEVSALIREKYLGRLRASLDVFAGSLTS